MTGRDLDALRNAFAKSNEEICQTLGKALGYPWFKDDPKNFPNATGADGVCVGDHVAESLAAEAADAIAALRARAERAELTIRVIAKDALTLDECKSVARAYEACAKPSPCNRLRNGGS